MHAKVTIFQVGQHVLVQATKNSNYETSRKLELRYNRSFIVTKVLDRDRYVVSELPGSKRSRPAYTGICHSERIKLFVTTDSSGKSSSSEDK